MSNVSVIYSLSLCALVLTLVRRWKKSTLPYPPGPKGYPILGNVLDLPANVPVWESLSSLASRHDTDILYLRLMGKDTVVLSSNGAISDLIEKRSNIYADRAQTTMMKLTGVTEWVFAMMSYGDGWRTRRKIFHEALNVRLTGNLDSHRYKLTHRFLSRLLEAPELFMQEAEFLPGAVMLSVTYGIDVKSTDDPFLSATLEGSHALATIMIPGKFLADAFPILRYIPDWFPGARFKVLANEVRDKYKASIDGPMEYVKSAMKSGEKFSQSITSDCLSRLEGCSWKADFNEELIREVSGTLFGAAAETTRILLQTLFLAMVLYPEVMKQAQEELDRLVGKHRLPEFSDREDLIYIDAIMKELLRWAPPLPFCVPNRTAQGDVYRGYYIPAGATVIQNIWAVFRDPTLYPDPEVFNPGRFLKDGKIDPLVFNPEDRAFGIGRRACPGKNFALSGLYLAIACVLSVFDIGPALDGDGKPQLPKAEFGCLLSRDPKPFKCTVKPRSEGAVKLVEEACDRAHG